jgi:hypothetical protein
MGDDATTTLATGGEIEAAPKPPVSLADELAGVKEALASEKKPKLFELPGYGRRLMVKYKVVDYDETAEIGEKVGEQVRAEQIDDTVVAGLTDTLVAACVGFYRGIDAEGKELSDDDAIPLEVVLGDQEGGPVRWGDDRLVGLLRIQPNPGETLRVRAIVRRALGDDKMLVVEHAQDVTRWMERARRQVATDF